MLMLNEIEVCVKTSLLFLNNNVLLYTIKFINRRFFAVLIQIKLIQIKKRARFIPEQVGSCIPFLEKPTFRTIDVTDGEPIAPGRVLLL